MRREANTRRLLGYITEAVEERRIQGLGVSLQTQTFSLGERESYGNITTRGAMGVDINRTVIAAILKRVCGGGETMRPVRRLLQ